MSSVQSCQAGLAGMTAFGQGHPGGHSEPGGPGDEAVVEGEGGARGHSEPVGVASECEHNQVADLV